MQKPKLISYSDEQKSTNSKNKNEIVDSSRIIIFDDIFPHLLSAFRIAEYNYYLENYKNVVVYTEPTAFNIINEKRNFEQVLDEYGKLYPNFKNKVKHFNSFIDEDVDLVYMIFLNNANRFLKIIEEKKIPFIFTLYPGGGFELNSNSSNEKLARVCSSPNLKRIIVTQNITKEYLINGNYIDSSKIESIYGGVLPNNILKNHSIQKKYFQKNKSTFDICFVANKYMQKGIDKGYDLFIEIAKMLVKLDANIFFHVVGAFDENDIDIKEIEDRIKFYGIRRTEFFSEFYSKMDIILSPNRPFILTKGGFDGFPTGYCIEAGLCGVAVFCTDELGLNHVFEEDKEIIILKYDLEYIFNKITQYYNDPNSLYKLAEKGKKRMEELFNIESQITARTNVLNEELYEIMSDKKQEKLLVSVCMITYNHENYIHKAISSILAQKVDFKLELIIGEDFSSDNTRQICEEYAELYPNQIKLLLSEKNIGMLPNFIRTLDACNGKYIALCEGDDYWTDPNKLQKQVDFLETNPDYAICFHEVKIWKENQHKLVDDFITKEVPETTTIKDLAEGNYIHTGSVIFRNRLLDKLPTYFAKSPVGDYFLHMLNARYGKIKKINDSMSVYRYSDTSYWACMPQEKKDELWLVMLKNIRIHFTPYIQELIDKQIISLENTNSIYTAEKLIENKNYDEASKLLNELLIRNTNNIDALNDLAVIAISENNINEANNLIEKVLNIDPQNEIALENLQYISENSEMGEISQIIGLNNLKREVNNKLIQAEKLIESNNYNEAAKLLDELLQIDSSNADALINLGVIAANTNNFEKSKNYFMEALKVNPLNEVAIENLEFVEKTILEEKQSDEKALEFTGERFVPEEKGQIAFEHYNRYMMAREYVADKRVLDIASGEGYGTALLSESANYVAGVDISEQAISHAINKYGDKENIEFKVGNCTKIPYEENQFDVVVSFETIEHIEEQEQFLKEIKRVLKDDGQMIISSPNKTIYSDDDYQNEFHLKELSTEEFQKLISENFKYAIFFGQRLTFSSHIWQLNPKSNNFKFNHYTELNYDQSLEPPFEPEYVIAICSNERIMISNSVSLFTGENDELLKDYHARGKWGMDINSELEEKKVELERIKSEYATLKNDYIILEEKNSGANYIKTEKHNKLLEAEKLIESNNYDEATELLDELLIENPHNIDALNDLAVINILEVKFKEAIDIINRVLEIDSQNEIGLENIEYIKNILSKELDNPNEQNYISKLPPIEFKRIDSYTDYVAYANQMRDVYSERNKYEKSILQTEEKFFIKGLCFVCKNEVDFLVDYRNASETNEGRIPNWRERLVCPECNLNNRMRLSLHLIEENLEDLSKQKVYIAEQTTPTYVKLMKKCGEVVGSEFLGDTIPLGECNENGIRNEDFTKLSFGNKEFNMILSFDVFEHIPDFKSAFSESFRILKEGGTLLFSVPFDRNSEQNIIRAEENGDGTINHILAPEYHGDPMNISEGCLCYYHFGWEMLKNLKDAGFTDVYSLFCYSKEYSYLGGDQIFFIAKK